MSGRSQSLNEPQNYFLGVGAEGLVSPRSVILFNRKTRDSLQQEALQNRSHHRLVLVCNRGTQGTIHLDNLALSFQPGQFLLIFPYQFHHFSHLNSSDLDWLFCTFELEPFVGLKSLRNRVVSADEESSRALEVLLGHWQKDQVELVQVSLQYLLVSLKRVCGASEPVTRLPREGEFFNTVNQRISEWAGSPLLVSELARQMGYSDSRLRALFRDAAGIPLGAYIRNFSLNRAMSLLRSTDFPISEIAEASGFGSAQSFCRVFKKEMGVTPRAYRMGRSMDPEYDSDVV